MDSKLIFKVQQILIIIYLIGLNFFIVFKTIEYSFPVELSTRISSIELLSEYYVPMCFWFIILIILILLVTVQNKINNLMYVILNMGLVFMSAFQYMILSIIGLILTIFSIGILVFLEYNRDKTR